MKQILTACLFLVLATLNAQSFEWNAKSAEPQPVRPNPAYERAYTQMATGLASVYAPSAQGTPTTSGESYVNSQFTASHPLLPVGTLLRVRNLDNNRVVSVRVNDRGQACDDCLLQLSQAAAGHLGIGYRGRVSVERTGFSNWNPAAPTAAVVATRPYGQSAPAATQWQSRGGTVAPQTYGQPPVVTPRRGEYAVLNAPPTPSVVAREVEPTSVSRQPATYSRYPSTQQPRVYQPSPRPVYRPTAQNPNVVTRQASPPASTVARYQGNRTVPAPSTYAVPTAPAAPQAYRGDSQLTARGVTQPAAAEYSVQLGAYSNEVYAKNRIAQLQGLGLSNVFYRAVQKPDGQTINRVYVGAFPTIAEAQQAAKLIQGQYQIAGIVASLR